MRLVIALLHHHLLLKLFDARLLQCDHAPRLRLELAGALPSPFARRQGRRLRSWCRPSRATAGEPQGGEAGSLGDL